MVFNEALARRIRRLLARRKKVEEKKLFNCACVLGIGAALLWTMFTLKELRP